MFPYSLEAFQGYRSFFYATGRQCTRWIHQPCRPVGGGMLDVRFFRYLCRRLLVVLVITLDNLPDYCVMATSAGRCFCVYTGGGPVWKQFISARNLPSNTYHSPSSLTRGYWLNVFNIYPVSSISITALNPA